MRKAAFKIKNLLTNAPKWCFFLPVEYEKHVCSNAEARADQRTHVHLDARLQAFWHRGGEILILKEQIFKTRDCQSIAGFSLFNPNQTKGKT
ncbi:MAG: hypothetical protein ABSC89_15865 [Verrucomicrobiota bacterium]